MIAISCVEKYAIDLGTEIKQFKQKSRFLYQRLLEIILKLDNIPNHDEGDEFLEMKNLNTELRLGQKFESLETLWSGNAIQEARKKETWPSVIEAVERDIT